MKKVWEIKRCRVQVGYLPKVKYTLGDISACEVPGVNDYDAELLATYDTKESAIDALKEYECVIETVDASVGTVLIAEEVWVSDATYDDDGEWVDSEGAWAWAPLNDKRGGMSNE